jgi:hypothetical protein
MRFEPSLWLDGVIVNKNMVNTNFSLDKTGGSLFIWPHY